MACMYSSWLCSRSQRAAPVNFWRSHQADIAEVGVRRAQLRVDLTVDGFDDTLDSSGNPRRLGASRRRRARLGRATVDSINEPAFRPPRRRPGASSSRETLRHCPGGRSPSSRPPNATRLSAVTSCPTAAAEAADLTVPPFTQLDDQVRFAPRPLAHAHGVAPADRRSPVDHPRRPRRPTGCRAPSRRSVGRRPDRVGEPVGELRVGGQEQQPGRGAIEPADGDEAGVRRRRAGRRRSAVLPDRAAS